MGLGNPGPQYEATRHNVGAWWLQDVAEQEGVELKPEKKFKGLAGKFISVSKACHLLLPTTYMNESGQSVQPTAQFYKIPSQNILVAHDDLDLPVGTVRLKQGGGHGGHNGLRDIIKRLGTPDFARLRIGIGHPGDKRLVHDYVLKKPSGSDEEVIRGALAETMPYLSKILAGAFEPVMNTLHTKS